LHRILCIAGVIGALATVIVAFDATAFSISPVPNQSSNVTLVAGGCGLGFHRGPYGGCRPNIAGYPRSVTLAAYIVAAHIAAACTAVACTIAVALTVAVAYTVAAACIVVAERYPFMALA
jgi:hypothetical protein